MLSELLAEAAHLANPAPEWPNFPFHNDSFPAPLIIINNRLRRTRPCRCCTPHDLRFVEEPGSATTVVSTLTSFRVTYRTDGFLEFHKLYGTFPTCNR